MSTDFWSDGKADLKIFDIVDKAQHPVSLQDIRHMLDLPEDQTTYLKLTQRLSGLIKSEDLQRVRHKGGGRSRPYYYFSADKDEEWALSCLTKTEEEPVKAEELPTKPKPVTEKKDLAPAAAKSLVPPKEEIKPVPPAVKEKPVKEPVKAEPTKVRKPEPPEVQVDQTSPLDGFVQPLPNHERRKLMDAFLEVCIIQSKKGPPYLTDYLTDYLWIGGSKGFGYTQRWSL